MNGRRSPSRGIVVGLGVLASLAALSLIVLQPAASNPNEPKVEICHATSSKTNPYISDDPAIADNGDLSGGHLNHTGPVFPAADWGDIIPPYVYTDAGGHEAAFPGRNWTPAGQAIWQLGCRPGLKPLTPIVECVEVGPGGGFLAHFGYDNPNNSLVQGVPENIFEPLSANGLQPTSFLPGLHSDVFQVTSTGGALTWHLAGNEVTASLASPHCQGSITIVKVLNPPGDSGRFNLEIDRSPAGGAVAVGDGGSTGTLAVDAGSHTVGESAAGGTDLSSYDIQISCLSGGAIVAEGSGAEVSVAVKSTPVVCTITNTLKTARAEVTPVLECVVFRGGAPDVASWGYSNPAAFSVTTPVGSRNGFDPAPLNRGQPIVFGPGRWVGVFETPFDGASSLTWTLGSRTVTASRTSQRCTSTIELRKVTVPADDPGVFHLQVNGATAVTGPNGTRSGPLIVGVGEGSVSETAGTGTNLGDYSSQIDCTRNGSLELSVSGTHADGAVSNGDVVVCTFTNTRTAPLPVPPPPAPPPPPTPPTDPQPAPTPPNPVPPTVDLSVRKTATPTTTVLGRTITFRVTVTNSSPVDAADVNVVRVSERSYRLQLISLTPSQGSCTGAVCSLGRIAAGGSATITAQERAVGVGLVLNVVNVTSEEQESDYANNTAAALVRIAMGPGDAKRAGIRATAATLACHTLTLSPSSLQKGSTSIVLAQARSRFGRPLKGLPVIAEGSGVHLRALTDRRGIAHLELTPRGIGLVHVRRARTTASASASSQCRSLLGVLGARSPSVTG